MGNIGFQELLVVAGVAFLCFGPKRLPELARALGEALRAFRRAMDEGMTQDTSPPGGWPRDPQPPVQALPAPAADASGTSASGPQADHADGQMPGPTTHA